MRLTHVLTLDLDYLVGVEAGMIFLHLLDGELGPLNYLLLRELLTIVKTEEDNGRFGERVLDLRRAVSDLARRIYKLQRQWEQVL